MNELPKSTLKLKKPEMVRKIYPFRIMLVAFITACVIYTLVDIIKNIF